jgi:hypothetical protein
MHNKNYPALALVLVLCLAVLLPGCQTFRRKPLPTSIIYHNSQYGFSFTLPASWKGYRIVTDKWEGLNMGPEGDEVVEQGPQLTIRNPHWSKNQPWQDIPIMVFTLTQWDALQKGSFWIGAAPIGPSELGRNSRYVFALPARYNFAEVQGIQEVETILASTPLHTP